MAEADPQAPVQKARSKRVGRYRIVSRLGQGAMATVYRAHDPDIQRDLAIKILNQQYRRDPGAVARFLQEARAAGALSHPNIVTIYDVGETDGFPYIAMELLNGRTLDKAIEERGAFGIEDVVHIGAQLADALRYAHDLGIVHRDIKPSNIILCEDGKTIKLLDFGIARVAQSAVDSPGEMVRTQIGQVLGTPRYMSPEQALSKPLDGRSDLFSVGAILYELVCGKPAFGATSIATLAVQIATQQHPPIEVSPECPRGLRFIIDKLLAKQPEKRFAGGAQLVAGLAREAAALNASTEERSRQLPLHLRFTLLASAVMAIALALGIGWVSDQQRRAMERVAITSGASIVDFVASNAALNAMENATRPAAEADWLPVQAFVKNAAADRNIVEMMVVDQAGVIQAATDPARVGVRYAPVLGQKLVSRNSEVFLSSGLWRGEVNVFRFARPIVYAGRTVGQVDVSIRKDELAASANLARTLLIAFGALMMLVAIGLSFVGARVVLRPVRRLNAALKEAGEGKLDFRISHNRRDEFGELFDNFNKLASVVQERLDRSDLAEAQAAAALLKEAASAVQLLSPTNTAGPVDTTATIIMERSA
jgi:eukaryotic-like serine/threonine-protein kinase